MTNEDLVLMIQRNEDKARHMGELYEQNRGIIAIIAKRYSEYAEIEDLMQESFFGLSEAAARWDPGEGVKFLTYAGYWIRAAIISYLRKREPAAVSLSAPIGGEDDDRALEDTLAAAGNPIEEALERMQHEQLSAELWSCVDDLEPRESAVIRSRYGNEQALTLKECGENLGVSVKRVRQVEAAALRKLSKPRYTKRILPYLDEGTAHSWGMRGTGRGVFERSGSVQERAMMLLEEIAGTNLYYGVKFPVFGNYAAK